MKSRRELLSETFSAVSEFGVAAAFTALSGRISLDGLQEVGNEPTATKEQTTRIA